MITMHQDITQRYERVKSLLVQIKRVHARAMCQRNDSLVDTHVNVTEDAESFSVIELV